MQRYLSNTAAEQRAMLDIIGAASIETLLSRVPAKARLPRALDLPQKPETVNKDPYGKGWMIVVKPSNAGEWDQLLSAPQYETFVAEAAH